MKVKIGNDVYDGSEQPIMVVLTDVDKENIHNMPMENHKYCQYPDTMSEEYVRKFMETV
jgi:hypothetical protein